MRSSFLVSSLNTLNFLDLFRWNLVITWLYYGTCICTHRTHNQTVFCNFFIGQCTKHYLLKLWSYLNSGRKSTCVELLAVILQKGSVRCCNVCRPLYNSVQIYWLAITLTQVFLTYSVGDVDMLLVAQQNSVGWMLKLKASV